MLVTRHELIPVRLSCGDVDSVRGFWCGKVSQVNGFFVDSDLSPISVIAQSDYSFEASAIRSSDTSIDVTLTICSFAQIIPTIIHCIAIAMINQARITISHQLKNDTMNKKRLPVYTDYAKQPSFRIQSGARYLPSKTSVPSSVYVGIYKMMSWPFPPGQGSCVWIIIETFMEIFLRRQRSRFSHFGSMHHPI